MKHIYPLLLLIMVSGMFGCQSTPSKPQQPIVILFENDVHCAVENYTKFSALRQEQLMSTPYVSVVSAGDFIQGGAISSLSNGQFIIDLMNAVPYDVVTVGNHEFDFGINREFELMDYLTAQAVCCNFTNEQELNNPYPAYTILSYGDVQVAYVGVTTPTAVTTSTPTFFQDSAGNALYSFHPDNVFQIIQKAVNQARREGADYVIVLSHLGDDTALDNSVDMIHATYGIDAVFDGHQHHILNYKLPNAKGDSVILASTGTAFWRMGRCVIDTTGHLSVDLIVTEGYEQSDAHMDALLDSIQNELSEITNEVIGHTEVVLTDMANGERAVRCMETNLSDLLTDAFRDWTQADICLMNGGGIRRGLRAGVITYGNLFGVIPFNNTMHKVACTGQQILDALEVGVALAPEENGDFMQTSGLRYTYRTDVPSSIRLDNNGLMVGIGSTRRVTSAEVERDGQWTALQPDSIYTVGGQSYVIINKGASGALHYLYELPCDHVSDITAAAQYLHKLGTVRAAVYSKAQGRSRVQ